MRLPARGTVLPFLIRWWNFRTTLAGRAWVACALVVSGAASTSLELPVYQLTIALSFFFFAAYLAGWALRPRIEVAWRLPEKAVAGQVFETGVHLINRSRGWARELGAGPFDPPPELEPVGPPPVSPGLEPGGALSLSFRLQAHKRGIYPWPALRVFSQFPFGLLRTPVRRTRDDVGMPLQSLMVYPSFHPLISIDVPISARYQPGGIALSSSVGESPEYIGNREYRPGDPPRRLDHRSWARLGKPVVREYQEEYYCRVALVLDTFIPPGKPFGRSGHPAFEAAVSLSAAIADVLARGEYIIDIFAAGPELYVFRAGRHTAHFENVLEILACVNLCRTNPFQKITPALSEELANTSSVICVFLDWDADRARLVRAAMEAGCSVKVCIVRNGAASLPVHDADLAGKVAQYTPDAVRMGKIDYL